MAAIKFDITGDNRNVLESFKGVQNGVRQMQSVVEDSGQSIEDMFKRVASAAGIALSLKGATDFVNKVKEVRSFFQDIESSMEVFLGNQEKAAAFTQQLKDYAFYNMFEFKDLAAASQQMIAYGNSVNDIIPILDKLSNVASGTGTDLMELVGLYNKAKSTGTVAANALYSWATKGVVVKDVLREMGEETDDTKITFEQLNKVLNHLTEEGGMFHDLMLNQMENLSAEEGQLQDELDAMYNEIGENYQDFLKGTIDTQIWLVEHYKEIGATLLTLVATYGTYRAALAATRAVERAEQKVEYNQHIKALEEEIEATKKLLPAKQDAKNADLAEAVAKKQLTEAQAQLIAIKREELAVLEKERDNLLNQSQGKVADLEKEVKFGQELVDIYKSEHDEAAESLRLATERKNKADEQVQSALDYLNAEKEIAATQGSAMSDVADAQREYDAAVAEQLAAAKELESAAEAENSTQTALNSVQKELNTTQERLNAAQTELDTVANTQNTVSTTANTAATTSNTMAQRLSTIATKAHTAAQAILKVTIDSVKNSWNAMKMAMMTNPIGAIVGGLTMAVGLFSTFISSSEDAKTASEKFGESADKAARNVESLYAILQSSSSQSKVHKDALAELKQVADEYGLTLDNEISLEEQLIERKKELIGLMREEAIERQKANDISTLTDSLTEKVEELRKDLVDDISDAFSDVEKNQIANLISEEQVEALVERMKEYKAALKANEERLGSHAYLARDAREANEALNAEYGKVMSSVQAYGEALGKEQDDINDAKGEVNDYIRHLVLLRVNYDETVEATNVAAQAAQLAEEATDGMTDSERIATLQNKNLRRSVDDLYGSVTQLLRDYANNNISFKLTIDATEVPDWMKTELGIKGNGTGNLDEAKKMAATYAAQLEYFNSHPFMLYNEDGKSRDEVATLAAEYAKAARDIEQDKDSWEKSKAEREKEAKKKAQEAKKALNERARRLKEIQRYNDLMEQQEQDRARAARDLELSTAQAQIDAMEEGSRKTIAQINLDFERQEEEIKRGYEDLKQKKIDQARQLFEANPANKGKVFDESSVNTEYTKEERENMVAQMNANAANYRRSMEEVAAAEMQNLYDYLKEYGSIEQQRYAITKEYDAKIAKENSETRKKILEEEKKSALSQVTAQSLAMNIDWSQTFSGLGNVLEGIAKETLANVRAYMKTDEYKGLGAADKQAYQDLVSQLVEAGGVEASSPFKTSTWNDIAKLAEEYKARVQDFLNAQKTHKEAVERLVEAENELKNATTPTAKAIAQMKVDMAQNWVDETGQQVKSSEREKDEANEKLHTSTESAAKGLDNFSTTLSQLTSGTLSGFATGVYNLVNQISGSGKKAAATLGEIGGKAGGLIGAILQIIDALGEDPAKFIEDLLAKVASVVEAILRDLPEIIVSIVKGVVNIVGGVVSGIGQLFGADISGIFGGSTHNFDEATKKWGWLLDTWKENLDYEKELMKEAYGEKVTEIQNKTAGQLRQTQQAAGQLYRAWASDGGGWFSHSNGYKDNKGANWKYLYDYDPELAKKMGAHKWNFFGNDIVSGGNVSNLFNLSADELEKLKYGNRQFWESLSENARKYLDTIIDAEKEIKQLEQEAREQLTATSFDSLSSDFQSQLVNMDSEAEDFADNFEKYMKNAVISSLMISKYKPLLEAWYKNFANAMESDSQLTAQEQEALKKEYDNIVNAALAERDRLKDMLDWSGGEEYTQEASSKGFQAMSQDTGEELNGRFTALQIAGETISSQIVVAVATLNGIASFSQSSNSAVLEIRNMMIMTNSYLEDMVKYAKLLYNDFGAKLDSIVSNTENM